MKWKNEFLEGVKGGIPIALGYLPVSFTFGLIAVSGGLPVWVACLISLTNLTSAGQFAGTSLILAGNQQRMFHRSLQNRKSCVPINLHSCRFSG